MQMSNVCGNKSVHNFEEIKQCGTEIVDNNNVQKREDWSSEDQQAGADADLIPYFLKSSICDKNERVTFKKVVCMYKHANEKYNY